MAVPLFAPGGYKVLPRFPATPTPTPAAYYMGNAPSAPGTAYPTMTPSPNAWPPYSTYLPLVPKQAPTTPFQDMINWWKNWVATKYTAPSLRPGAAGVAGTPDTTGMTGATYQPTGAGRNEGLAQVLRYVYQFGQLPTAAELQAAGVPADAPALQIALKNVGMTKGATKPTTAYAGNAPAATPKYQPYTGNWNLPAGWWNRFQEAHPSAQTTKAGYAGQTPTQFYAQTGEGLEEALWDLKWSQDYQRATGNAPSDEDWRLHWYATHGGYPMSDTERRAAKKQRREEWRKENKPEPTPTPAWNPSPVYWGTV